VSDYGGVSGIAENPPVSPSANEAVFLPELSGETAQILESTRLGEKDTFLTHHDYGCCTNENPVF